MPDDLPHRITALAARLRKRYHGDHTAALLEEAAARIREMEAKTPPTAPPDTPSG